MLDPEKAPDLAVTFRRIHSFLGFQGGRLTNDLGRAPGQGARAGTPCKLYTGRTAHSGVNGYIRHGTSLFGYG